MSGTKDFGILYSTSIDFNLVGYIDSDCGSSINDRENTFGYVFHFGIGVVSWASKKQPIVTLSSVEVEYMLATSSTSQVVWMWRMLKDLMHAQKEATTIFCDYNSMIAFSKIHVSHKRTKHIDNRYHFIRDLVNNKEICLDYCKCKDKFTSIFTKPLVKETF